MKNKIILALSVILTTFTLTQCGESLTEIVTKLVDLPQDDFPQGEPAQGEPAQNARNLYEVGIPIYSTELGLSNSDGDAIALNGKVEVVFSKDRNDEAIHDSTTAIIKGIAASTISSVLNPGYDEVNVPKVKDDTLTIEIDPFGSSNFNDIITITIKDNDDGDNIIEADTTLIISDTTDSESLARGNKPGELVITKEYANGVITEINVNENRLVENVVYEGTTPYKCTDPDYIPIITQTALENMELTGKYCLVKDITLTGNFTPIGQFAGTLDGEGKKITGLNITATSNNVGLFAEIGSGGTVKNLTIENPTVSGKDNVGALAGRNEGSIDNVQVIGGSITASRKVGGLVGYNSSGGEIRNSSANTQNIGSTASDQVGGLVGRDENGTIEKSYADTENIKGGSNIGGLVGFQQQGTIENSYANTQAMNLTSNSSRVGGLVGIAAGSTITNCYANLKNITFNGNNSNSNIKWFVGGVASVSGGIGDADPTIKNCYYYYGGTDLTEISDSSYGSPEEAILTYEGEFIGYATNSNDEVVKQGNDPNNTEVDKWDLITNADFNEWDFNSIWNPVNLGQWPTLR